MCFVTAIAKYEGCFIDKIDDRDLSENLKLGRGAMTNALCWDHCKGYKYAGTQVRIYPDAYTRWKFKLVSMLSVTYLIRGLQEDPKHILVKSVQSGIILLFWIYLKSA